MRRCNVRTCNSIIIGRDEDYEHEKGGVRQSTDTLSVRLLPDDFLKSSNDIITTCHLVIYCVIYSVRTREREREKERLTLLSPPNSLTGFSNWNGGSCMYLLTWSEKSSNPLGGDDRIPMYDWNALSMIDSSSLWPMISVSGFFKIPLKYLCGWSESYCSTSTPTTK